jgi:16S rRNA (uracil1498-N3)-methyltransferase
MIRLFVDPAALVAGELTVRGDEHHYLARVRRARVGEAIELVDGAGRRAAAQIARMTEAEATLVAEAPEAIAAAPPVVRALVPMIKGDRMEGCIEKLVEVGADAIAVWPAARSVVRLDDARREARLGRYRAIAQAAARQSGRARVPEVTAAASLRAAIGEIAAVASDAIRMVLDPASDAAIDAAIEVAAAAAVAIVSGPEGGLTAEEIELLVNGGWAPVGLGPRVLRADTAPVIAVALIRAATRS